MIEPDFAKGNGLVPAIAQDWRTGRVLMLAYINREAWQETIKSGFAVYYSRSRSQLWRKGEQSGNRQKVKEILLDCDSDTVLFKIEQIGGAACHTGHESCFFRRLTAEGGVEETDAPLFDPAEVYGH